MSNEATAKIILYELWFSVAETIFNRVCEITELTENNVKLFEASRCGRMISRFMWKSRIFYIKPGLCGRVGSYAKNNLILSLI